jgi:soluble lytic murein transglycosylase-like protein
MRFALLASVVVLSFGAACRPVAASPYKQANEYYKVRDRARIQENVPAEELQLQPLNFAGKLVEVRGLISALLEGTDGSATLLLQSKNVESAPAYTVVVPTGTQLSQWSFMEVGSSVRVLCRVVTVAGSSTGSLELVIPVSEYEAAAVDAERDKAAKEAALKRATELRQKKVGPQMASRGTASAIRKRVPQYSYEQLVEIYSSAVRYFNRSLSPSQARRIAGTIIDYSTRYKLDARLVMAVIAVESNFNQHAVSPVGAMGLGQLMPGTAGDLGVGDAFDLRANLEGSTRLLSSHIRNMKSDGRVDEEAIKLALACYNAGAGAVKKYKGIPPYRETQNYVAKITRLYRQMCGLE